MNRVVTTNMTKSIARWSLLAALGAVVALGAQGRARAQDTVPQPAESGRERSESEAAGEETGTRSYPPSWEALPSYESETVGERPIREEEAIGEYNQPRWTARRRFPTTRVYVRPAGLAAFEWWLETKLNLEDTDEVRYRSQYELEFGLGHRLQLDLYLETQQLGHDGPWELHSEKFELRWALANWGVIPTNPTLYVEWVRQHDGPPKGEIKLLLGGEIAPRWHWGANLVFEHAFGDEETAENETALTGAVAYTIADSIFSLGVELKLETVDLPDNRYSFDNYEVLAGPTLQVRPIEPMHVDLVALFGSETEGDETTTLAEPVLVAGWEF